MKDKTCCERTLSSMMPQVGVSCIIQEWAETRVSNRAKGHPLISGGDPINCGVDGKIAEAGRISEAEHARTETMNRRLLQI
jgi:hypothetical protein